MNPAESQYKTSEIALRVAVFVVTLLAFRTLASWVLPSASPIVRAVLVSFAGGAAANVLTVRFFASGRLAEMGLGWDRRSARQLLLGLIAGAGGAVLMLGVPLATGLASLEPLPEGSGGTLVPLLILLVLLAFGALGEELMFHGHAFQFLVRTMGVFATILPVSALFGLMHAGNQNFTPIALLNTMFFGFLLGWTVWRTEALWLALGIHFGWNVMLPVFGANLSGFTMGMTGYVLRWNASDLWSGGQYGPEGGLLGTLAAIAIFAAVRRVR